MLLCTFGCGSSNTGEGSEKIRGQKQIKCLGLKHIIVGIKKNQISSWKGILKITSCRIKTKSIGRN